MNFHFLKRPLITAATMTLLATAASAQDASSPLLVVMLNGDSPYAYDGTTLAPLTGCQPEGENFMSYPLDISPDSTRFTFITMPDNLIDESNEVMIPINANNLWVCETATQTLSSIATQPDDAFIDTADPANSHYVTRSNAVWSPDSTQVAWAEQSQPGGATEIVIYNLATSDRRVVFHREERSVGLIVPTIEWGPGWLSAFDILAPAAEGQNPLPTLWLFNPDTGEERTIQDENLPQGRFIEADGKGYYWVGSAADGGLDVLDPATGERLSIPGTLETYATANPDTSLRLIAAQFGPGEPEWSIVGPDFGGMIGIQGNEYAVALSPDGSQLAFVTFEHYPQGGKAYIMVDPIEQTANLIEGTDANYGESGALYVFWGNMALRVAASQ